MGRLGQLLSLQQLLLSSAVATSAMQIYQLRIMFGFAGTSQLLLGRNILTLLLSLFSPSLFSLSHLSFISRSHPRTKPLFRPFSALHLRLRSPPRFAVAYFGGEIFGNQVLFEFEFFGHSATSRRYVCYTFRRARRRGDAFRRAVCRVLLNRVSAVVCVWDSGISVEYIKEEKKLLKIQIALQNREREVGLAEAALRASYAEEVYGLTRDVDCPHEHDGYDPSYIMEFRMLARDSCRRCKGTGRMFPGMICHELSLVVLLHMRPRQARRLDNRRVLCHRLESSSRLPAPATRTPLEIYQHELIVLYVAISPGSHKG